MKDFHEKIKKEIELLQLHPIKNAKKIRFLSDLLDVGSVDDVIIKVNLLPYPHRVRLVAGSAAIHDLIVLNPQPFLNIFSDNNYWRGVLYCACVSRNIALVKCLVENLQIEVTKIKIGDPNVSSTDKDDVLSLDNVRSIIQVAAESGSLDLIQYLASIYLDECGANPALPVIGKRDEFQVAMVIAANKRCVEVVRYLLAIGVDANAEYENGRYSAITEAVLHANSLEIVTLLVENGAKIASVLKENMLEWGRLDIVKYISSKGERFDDLERYSLTYFIRAFKSGSVALIKFLLNDLQISLYDATIDTTGASKEYCKKQFALAVCRSGSIDLFNYLETELDIPVTEMIRDELSTTDIYHHSKGDFLMVESVCSYHVNFVVYLFETKNLMPNRQQLLRLQSYAYDCGSSEAQHKKFTTHAYVYSFIHGSAVMATLLRKTSATTSLRELNIDELQKLYTDYSTNFPQPSLWQRYGVVRERENSLHLSREIGKRKYISGAMSGFFQRLNMPGELGIECEKHMDMKSGTCVALTNKLSYELARPHPLFYA